MEAPEKIYVPTAGDELHYHMTCPNNEFQESIEYIRTDAFIKKACVKLKKLMYDNLMFQGRLHRDEVIEAFIENFKKYIEE